MSVIHSEILASAAQWLRYERQCMLICTERALYPWGIPDIIGVTLKRKAIEVEIKVSLSDFRANFKKASHTAKVAGVESACPHEFYFFVPPELAPRIKEELPNYAGLLTLSDRRYMMPCRSAEVIIEAPKFNGPTLEVKDIARAAKHMSGTLTRLFSAQFVTAKETAGLF